MTMNSVQHLWKSPQHKIVSSSPQSAQMIVSIEDAINRAARLDQRLEDLVVNERSRLGIRYPHER